MRPSKSSRTPRPNRERRPSADAEPAAPPRRLDARWDFWIVLAVAVAARLVYVAAYLCSPLRGLLQADQALYWDWGVAISQGDWLGAGVFRQGPLYPYLLGALLRVTGPVQWPAWCLQMAAGVLTCLLTFAVARRLTDRATALVAGCLAACYGPLVFYECMILKTFLSPLLTMVALWAAVRFGERPRLTWLCLAGAAVGLACLERENQILLLIPLALWCRRVLRSGKLETPADTAPASPTIPGGWLGASVVLAVACLSMILPATLRNRWVAGEWIAVTSGGGEVFYLAHGPYAAPYYAAPPFIRPDPRYEHEDFQREASRLAGRPLSPGESSRFWFRESLGQAVTHPGRALRLTLAKGAVLLNSYEVPDGEDYQIATQVTGVLALFPRFGWICALGLWGMGVAVRRPACWLPLGMLLVHAGSVLLLFNYSRFRLGMMPIWTIFAAIGLVWLTRSLLGRDKSSPGMLAAGLAFVAIVSLWSNSPPLGYAQTRYAADAKATLEILKQRGRTLAELPELRRQAATERAAASQDHGADARRRLAAALAQTGDYDGALEVLRQVLAEGAHPAVRDELVALYFERGWEARGLEQLADPPDVSTADGRFELATRFDRAGHRQLAQEHYRRTLALAPEHAEAHFNLAVLFTQEGRVDEAIAEYREALSARPEYADAHNNLGTQLARRGAFAEAEQHFAAALASDPGHERARVNLDLARQAQGKR